MAIKTAISRKTSSARHAATPILSTASKIQSSQIRKTVSPLATALAGAVVIRKGSTVNRKVMKPLTFSKLVSTPIGVQETIDVIRATLPPTVVSEAMDFLSAPRNELLAALRIPVSSFHRKLTTKQALSPEETERVMRLADITRTATGAFGGQSEARAWLNAANIALGGQSPFSLLDTDAGAGQVRRVLTAVNYGGVL